MCLKFHSLPVTSHDTTKCELYGREGLEKFAVQVVLLGCSQNQKKHLTFPYLMSYSGLFFELSSRVASLDLGPVIGKKERLTLSMWSEYLVRSTVFTILQVGQ